MEQAQRERRNHNETNGISHVPQWFVKTSKTWTFKDDYWTQRNDANFNELNLTELWWHASTQVSRFFIVIYQQINFSYDFHTNRFFYLQVFSNNQPHGLRLKNCNLWEKGENASGKLNLTKLSFHYAWDHILVSSFHDSCNHSIQCSFLNILKSQENHDLQKLEFFQNLDFRNFIQHIQCFFQEFSYIFEGVIKVLTCKKWSKMYIMFPRDMIHYLLENEILFEFFIIQVELRKRGKTHKVEKIHKNDTILNYIFHCRQLQFNEKNCEKSLVIKIRENTTVLPVLRYLTVKNFNLTRNIINILFVEKNRENAMVDIFLRFSEEFFIFVFWLHTYI